MSLYQLFKNVIPRLTRTQWGSKITDRDGNERDPGVNDLAEELASLLSIQAPLALDEPIRIIKNYTGTTFEVVTEPDVEAANDPLSVDAFGGVKLNLEDVRDLALEAQGTAEDAKSLAVRQIIFPGIVKVVGDQNVLVNTRLRRSIYEVEIDRGNVVRVDAFPWKTGDRLYAVNTRVLVFEVGEDQLVADYFRNFNPPLESIPNYYFIESFSTA